MPQLLAPTILDPSPTGFCGGRLVTHPLSLSLSGDAYIHACMHACMQRARLRGGWSEQCALRGAQRAPPRRRRAKASSSERSFELCTRTQEGGGRQKALDIHTTYCSTIQHCCCLWRRQQRMFQRGPSSRTRCWLKSPTDMQWAPAYTVYVRTYY